MARGAIVRHLWFIRQLDAGRRVTATLLAAEFGVSVRTAYRDMDSLRDDWCVPMQYERRAQSWKATKRMDGLLRKLVA
jgi:predicted DNA-binding transcriptional regulator YafY